MLNTGVLRLFWDERHAIMFVLLQKGLGLSRDQYIRVKDEPFGITYMLTGV